jgi:hypothetical protein
LSFNTPKFTRDLDALSYGGGAFPSDEPPTKGGGYGYGGGHFHPINHRPEVDGINMVDIGIGED